jgi:hypothetical protein
MDTILLPIFILLDFQVHACYDSNHFSVQYTSINLLKPTGYYTYHQILNSKILQADYIAFMCFVCISEETVTFALYTVNRLVFIT